MHLDAGSTFIILRRRNCAAVSGSWKSMLISQWHLGEYDWGVILELLQMVVEVLPAVKRLQEGIVCSSDLEQKETEKSERSPDEVKDNGVKRVLIWYQEQLYFIIKAPLSYLHQSFSLISVKNNVKNHLSNLFLIQIVPCKKIHNNIYLFNLIDFNGIKFLRSSSAALKGLKLNVNIYVRTSLEGIFLDVLSSAVTVLWKTICPLSDFIFAYFLFVPTDNRQWLNVFKWTSLNFP